MNHSLTSRVIQYFTDLRVHRPSETYVRDFTPPSQCPLRTAVAVRGFSSLPHSDTHALVLPLLVDKRKIGRFKRPKPVENKITFVQIRFFLLCLKKCWHGIDRVRGADKRSARRSLSSSRPNNIHNTSRQTRILCPGAQTKTREKTWPTSCSALRSNQEPMSKNLQPLLTFACNYVGYYRTSKKRNRCSFCTPAVSSNLGEPDTTANNDHGTRAPHPSASHLA